MCRKLRGHHLLCTHGFQGMGYSPAFIKKMTEIVEEIQNEEKEFNIQVLAGLDDACFTCPHQGQTTCEKSEDSNQHVIAMDLRVINHLGLKVGETYSKKELIHLTVEKVIPDDLDHLCQGCSWLSYGVCKEGIAALKEKHLMR
jgi:hypothetical protein